MSSLSPGLRATRTASAQTAAADVLHAAVAVVVVGTALGLSCRAWREGSAGPLGAVLADLGAPWVLTAFAAGAGVGGRDRAAAVVERSSGVLAGGLAGGGALALASLVYYEGSTDPRAVLWMGLGLTVGGLAGGAGATWATWRRSAAGATAATALGLSLAAEGVARFGGALRLEGGPTADVTVLVLVGLGVLVPLVLARGGPLGVAGSVGVLALVVPTASLLAAAPVLLAL